MSTNLFRVSQTVVVLGQFAVQCRPTSNNCSQNNHDLRDPDQIGRCGPTFDPKRPSSVEILASSTDCQFRRIVGHARQNTKFGRFRVQCSAGLSQTWSGHGQLWVCFGQISARFDPFYASVDQIRLVSTKFGPGLVQIASAFLLHETAS